MAAGSYDIEIERGETFSFPLQWKTAQGSGIAITAAELIIKPSFESETQLQKFSSADASPKMTLPDANNGKALLKLTDADIAEQTWSSAVYYFVVTVANGDKFKILKGCICICEKS